MEVDLVGLEILKQKKLPFAKRRDKKKGQKEVRLKGGIPSKHETRYALSPSANIYALVYPMNRVER